MTLPLFMFVIQAVSWWGIDHVKCLNINLCLFWGPWSFSLMTHSAPWRALLRKIWFWKKTPDNQVIKLHCVHKFQNNTSHYADVYQCHFTGLIFVTVTALIVLKYLLFSNSSATQNLYMLPTLSGTVNNQIHYSSEWFTLSHMFTLSGLIAGVDYSENDVALQQFPAAVYVVLFI